MKTTGSATGNATPATEYGDILESFDRLLSSEQGKGEAGEQAESEADEAELEASEGTTDDAADEADAEEAPAESEDDESEGSDEATTKTFRVKVDGEEVDVPLDELLAGYSRTADYTRKTQALATDRKVIEQERAAARQERAEYAALLPQLRGLVEKGLEQEPDWAKLKAEDPLSYTIQREEWREKREKLFELRAEEARVARQRQDEEAKEAAEILQQERSRLVNEVLPHWRDAKVAASEAKQIAEFMLRNGFTKDELEVHDSRALGVLWKAWKFEQVQKAKPGVQQKVAAARVAAPSQRTARPKASAQQQARARLAKSGSVKDAAALFETFL